MILGVGDDAALLRVPQDADLVAAVDTLVAGRHFLPHSDPRSIGHRALAVNLSDMAAMGATPAWATLALTLPRADVPWLEGFSAGLMSLADAHGVAIVFHDKSRVTEEFVRQNFVMSLAADDGFTQRSVWGNPKLASEVVKDRLAKITIPTLVVWGGSDEIVPLEQGKAYAVPECGHGPSIEKPKEFLDAVLPFLP